MTCRDGMVREGEKRYDVSCGGFASFFVNTPRFHHPPACFGGQCRCLLVGRPYIMVETSLSSSSSTPPSQAWDI